MPVQAERTSLRPIRSRKDRPCDYCRQLKHSCHITTRGEPCANCTKTNRECTFYDPPRKRRRGRDSSCTMPPSMEDTPSDESRRGSGQAFGELMRRPMLSGGASSRNSLHRSGTWETSGTRPTTGGGYAPGVESALSGFLDSLDEEERGQQALVSTRFL